ncbi:uncharacterized protein YgfB (UPF0149 family) [Flavobacterium sp. 7A]|nr:uncharacterized protein YgfB (UPF0149 family) [Flavobacterium sp. 7A]
MEIPQTSTTIAELVEDLKCITRTGLDSYQDYEGTGQNYINYYKNCIDYIRKENYV